MKRIVARYGFGPVIAALLALNLLLLAPFAWSAWREHRTEQALERQRIAWQAMPLYAPTEIVVALGPTPLGTTVIERPIDRDGPRILAVFEGTWRVQLIDAVSDELLCIMPAQPAEPGKAVYRPGHPRILRMTWPQYTGGAGACFAQMLPCGVYQLRTLRQAERYGVKRFLEPVMSAEFTTPCPERRLPL